MLPVFRTSHCLRVNGDGEIRTLDPLLARQVLSQLSYTPTLESGTHLLSHIVSNIVPSAACVLTIVFGMGTGVSHWRIGTGIFFSLLTFFSPPKPKTQQYIKPLLLLPLERR